MVDERIEGEAKMALQGLGQAASGAAEGLAKQSAMDKLQEQVQDASKTEQFRNGLMMSIFQALPSGR
jgi:hypothetical protein